MWVYFQCSVADVISDYECAGFLTCYDLGLNPSFHADLALPLRPAIPPDAAHSAGLLGLELFREYHVPPRPKLLLHYHLPGLQRYVSFPLSFATPRRHLLTKERVALPFLSRTEVLLVPIPILVILWVISLFTFDCATNLAPVLWCGVNLRKPV